MAMVFYQEHKQGKFQNQIVSLGLMCCALDVGFLDTGDSLKYLRSVFTLLLQSKLYFHRWFLGSSEKIPNLPAWKTGRGEDDKNTTVMGNAGQKLDIDLKI